jgi:hypothetical protein
MIKKKRRLIIKISLALALILSCSWRAMAQEKTPQLLLNPASWTFERFTLPPVFAPDLPYKGAEELRFSPGMFNKDSVTYFTYAFAAQLDNTITISQKDVKDYLLRYFKGLCGKTAMDRKLKVDTSAIKVLIENKKMVPSPSTTYNIRLDIFGVFTDGAPVKLNMEARVLNAPALRKSYIIFIASPLPKTDEAWKELYKIQRDFVIPANNKN